MASMKFTKETIAAYAENIKHYANQMLDALKDDDLNEVMTQNLKIDRETDNINASLMDCEDF